MLYWNKLLQERIRACYNRQSRGKEGCMGRKSVRKDKNVFQLRREELSLTREEASELLQFISEDRIEKIENEKSLPHPDEVLKMASVYKKPALCNHYCSQICPIGQRYVPEVEMKELSQIVLEMLAHMNALEKNKERLIEICMDGRIDDDQYEDFRLIRDRLSQMSRTLDSLRYWVENGIAEGQIDGERLE